ncbi:S8 family serine peptidase [Pontiella sp.]|uniref:S8 family peptidase n=1 Tax=Pontiella sp. TaxID=2837462 RepID=UPI003569C08C
MIGIVFAAVLCRGAALRLEGGRAWLKAEGTPVSKVLQLFEQRGAEVLIDPSLELGRVDGEWEDTDVDRLIGQLVSPHSYSIQWKLVESPLGGFYQVSSIRVFGDTAAAVKRISSPERVLDVVVGADGTKYIRGEILVGFKTGSTVNDLNALLRLLNGTVIEVIDPPGIYRIKLNDGLAVEEAVKTASAFPMVDAADANRAFSSAGAPPVALSGTNSGIHLGLVPGGTAIAVFDSGLDPAYAGMDFISGTYNALNPGAAIDDPTGHGTLVSLIAAGAVTPEGETAGSSSASVLSVKVFDENGMTSSDILMSMVNYAVESDIGVINLSFGTYEDVGFLENSVQYAASQGITIFVASGNDGLDTAVNPAASSATVSVGAANPDGSIADYSNTQADTFSSGTVYFGGSTYYGTSFASPYTAYLYATGSQ